MSSNSFRTRILKNLEKYKTDELKIKDYEVYNYILPKEKLDYNLLPGIRHEVKNIKYHSKAHHLNSSQMMCVNFFYPFKSSDKGKEILMKTLIDLCGLRISENSKIDNVQFEYKDGKGKGERTRFDLYIKLNTGENIYFEIKYTESEFGRKSLNDARLNSNWSNVYRPHLVDTVYLKNIGKNDFYRNFQIYRNIWYLHSNRDYLFFLIPKENTNLVKQLEDVMDKLGSSDRNIKIIDWMELSNQFFKQVQGTQLESHYKEFKNKYLPD